MEDIIKDFQGENSFLSNFFEAPVRINNKIFPTSEHAFQALKSWHEDDWDKILKCETAGRAKRAGRKLRIREDWEEVKLKIMKEIIRRKFSQHPDLADKLVATEQKELQEGNNWGDTFWGISNGKGQNNLGIILMEVREELVRFRHRTNLWPV